VGSVAADATASESADEAQGGRGPHDRGRAAGGSRPGGESWAPALLLLGVTAAVCFVGYVQKLACKSAGFDLGQSFQNACYTDIYPLYFGRGLVDGKVPYIDQIPEPVEYPAVTGMFMHVIAALARWFTGGPATAPDAVAGGMLFYDLTVIALAGCALAAVLATALAAGRHGPRAGLMFALAPGLLLCAYVNWDLLAIMLGALAVLAWARRAPVAAGVALGLAVAAKFYPVVFLGPLFLLCLRAGRLPAFVRTFAAAAGTWVAVHGLVLLAAGDQWRVAWEGLTRFYAFSRERPADWGSVWYFAQQLQVPFAGDPDRLNALGAGTFVVLCAAIAALALLARRRPRLPQLLLLVLVAFMLTNKVWSPQYVLWLLPVVALARPRLPAYLAWQLAEIGYFLGIWFYLLGLQVRQDLGPDRELYPVPFLGRVFALTADEIDDIYWVALLGRFLAVTLLAVLVVREILRPERDIVRADGGDDPAGGVLDGAADRTVLARWRSVPVGSLVSAVPKTRRQTRHSLLRSLRRARSVPVGSFVLPVGSLVPVAARRRSGQR
jgi:hypothetical protein